jgi:hypothetical protein
MGLRGMRAYFFLTSIPLPAPRNTPDIAEAQRKAPERREFFVGGLKRGCGVLRRRGMRIALPAGSVGMGIPGSQFLEPSEEQPLGLDRQQWVRDLEWRAHVPDDLDRRRVEQ